MHARHLFAATAIAFASAVAHAAPALSTNLGTDPTAATIAGPVLFSGTKSFTFELTQVSDVFGTLSYLPEFQAVDITSIQLVSDSGSWTFGTPNSGSFSFTGLLAGDYTLNISASSSGFGVYAGSLSAVAAPVPEAESLALALAGLGVVGFIAAKRRKA